MADTKYTLNCPACGKEMKKVFIEDAGVNIDICVDGCGGILFDNRELEKFDESHENADQILNEVKGKIFEKVDTSKPRICPVCNAVMFKMGAGQGNVKADVCGVCGAKFLDNGELEKIRVASNEEYEVPVKTQLAYSELEKGVNKETLGSFGTFINDHVKTTGSRKAVEDFMNKFLADRRHID